MQNTRLSRIPSFIVTQIEEWLKNPWRSLASHTIGALTGFLIGVVIATYTGQTAVWDLPAAGVLVAIVELVSWYFYRPGTRSPIGMVFHTVKLGLTYNLILESFKLGS
jgi:hypothetical protein